MDYTDIDCQKRLIKIFLNSVFVYDDKVVLTFNYSEDGKILTLHEIDGGSGHSIRIPSGLVHHAKKSVLKRTLFFIFRQFYVFARLRSTPFVPTAERSMPVPYII